VLVDTIPERDVVTWPAICTNNQLIQRQRADLIKKIGGGKCAPRNFWPKTRTAQGAERANNKCAGVTPYAWRLLPLWEANTLKINRPSEIDAAYVTRLHHRYYYTVMMLKHHLMSLEMISKHFESSLMINIWMSICVQAPECCIHLSPILQCFI